MLVRLFSAGHVTTRPMLCVARPGEAAQGTGLFIASSPNVRVRRLWPQTRFLERRKASVERLLGRELQECCHREVEITCDALACACSSALNLAVSVFFAACGAESLR